MPTKALFIVSKPVSNPKDLFQRQLDGTSVKTNNYEIFRENNDYFYFKNDQKTKVDEKFLSGSEIKVCEFCRMEDVNGLIEGVDLEEYSLSIDFSQSDLSLGDLKRIKESKEKVRIFGIKIWPSNDEMTDQGIIDFILSIKRDLKIISSTALGVSNEVADCIFNNLSEGVDVSSLFFNETQVLRFVEAKREVGFIIHQPDEFMGLADIRQNNFAATLLNTLRTKGISDDDMGLIKSVCLTVEKDEEQEDEEQEDEGQEDEEQEDEEQEDEEQEAQSNTTYVLYELGCLIPNRVVFNRLVFVCGNQGRDPWRKDYYGSDMEITENGKPSKVDKVLHIFDIGTAEYSGDVRFGNDGAIIGANEVFSYYPALEEAIRYSADIVIGSDEMPTSSNKVVWIGADGITRRYFGNVQISPGMKTPHSANEVVLTYPDGNVQQYFGNVQIGDDGLPTSADRILFKYPDGTTRALFKDPNGTETQYSNAQIGDDGLPTSADRILFKSLDGTETEYFGNSIKIGNDKKPVAGIEKALFTYPDGTKVEYSENFRIGNNKVKTRAGKVVITFSNGNKMEYFGDLNIGADGMPTRANNFLIKSQDEKELVNMSGVVFERVGIDKSNLILAIPEFYNKNQRSFYLLIDQQIFEIKIDLTQESSPQFSIVQRNKNGNKEFKFDLKAEQEKGGESKRARIEEKDKKTKSKPDVNAIRQNFMTPGRLMENQLAEQIFVDLVVASKTSIKNPLAEIANRYEGDLNLSALTSSRSPRLDKKNSATKLDYSEQSRFDV